MQCIFSPNITVPYNTKQVTTTNYDQLMEKAWRLSGPFSCLPYKPRSGCKRWLLKLHGCITHPEALIFTKQDYFRFADRFAALAGIVQSSLLTKHMLFVGFSFDDDNFQRIFDSVRKARTRTLRESVPVSEARTSAGAEDDAKPSDSVESVVKKKLNASTSGYPTHSLMKLLNLDEFDDVEQGVCGTALMLSYSQLKVSWYFNKLIRNRFLQN